MRQMKISGNIPKMPEAVSEKYPKNYEISQLEQKSNINHEK